MSNWIYTPELVSCLFFAILLSFSFTRRTRSVRSLIFCAGMLCAMLVTIFNVLSIWSLANVHLLPPGMTATINNLYFAFLPLMAGTLIWYELELMYESEDPHKHKKKLNIAMLVIYVLHLVLLIINRYTEVVYRFDENEQYHRGPLIILMYMHFVLYVLIALTAFFDQRNVIDIYQKRVLMIVPLLAFAIVGFNYIFPQMQLNGTAMAASALIIFGNFQNRQINTDQLTRLATRDRFYYDLQYMFERKKPFYVISVKISDFKSINRIFGQIVGDRFLKEISIRLRSLDRHARVYRLGGVHFTMIVRGRSGAENLFERVAGIFREPINLGDTRCSVNAAIADICCPDMASDVNNVIEALEYAISLSVKAGRPVRFDREVRRKRERREHLILLMRRALLDDGFFLEYQPVYDSVQKRFVSAEVLLRLKDNDGTVIPPGEFIPIAEESGLIVDISWLVLDKACAFLHTHSTWTGLSVNMSVQQFQEPGVVAKIMRCIDRYGIHPEQLSLEITERTFSTSEDKVISVMRALAGRGVRFHLDDFGTGYSNLAAVFSMPFQYVKLDRSIINALSHDRRTQLMVRGLIDSFMQTGTGLIAEGVETSESAQMVQELGIRRIQGFYFSRPLSEEVYLALLAEQGSVVDLTPVIRSETDSHSPKHLSS